MRSGKNTALIILFQGVFNTLRSKITLNIKLTVLLTTSVIFAHNSKGHCMYCVLHSVWFTFRSCLLKMISGHPPFSLRFERQRGIRESKSMDNRICFPLGACEPMKNTSDWPAGCSCPCHHQNKWHMLRTTGFCTWKWTLFPAQLPAASGIVSLCICV